MDADGDPRLVDCLVQTLEQPIKQRSVFQIRELVPLVRNLPFFKERKLKDSAINECLSLMTLKVAKKDEFVIEYGTFGEEFYVILEGDCEVLVPNQQTDDFQNVTKEKRFA